jgi:hypothetical protein
MMVNGSASMIDRNWNICQVVGTLRGKLSSKEYDILTFQLLPSKTSKPWCMIIHPEREKSANGSLSGSFCIKELLKMAIQFVYIKPTYLLAVVAH